MNVFGASMISLSQQRNCLPRRRALAGHVDAARRHMTEYLKPDPGMTVARFVGEIPSVPIEAVSPVYLRENARILDGLHRVGMPDG
jgi:hypothetical protein